jgi:hypothetical protein
MWAQAAPHELHSLVIAVGAPHVQLPARASRHTNHLDFRSQHSALAPTTADIPYLELRPLVTSPTISRSQRCDG